MEHESSSLYSLVPILSQISSVTALTVDFMYMLFNILIFMFKSSRWCLSVRLSYQNIFPPPMCNVCLAYLFFYVVTLIIFG